MSEFEPEQSGRVTAAVGKSEALDPTVSGTLFATRARPIGCRDASADTWSCRPVGPPAPGSAQCLAARWARSPAAGSREDPACCRRFALDGTASSSSPSPSGSPRRPTLQTRAAGSEQGPRRKHPCRHRRLPLEPLRRAGRDPAACVKWSRSRGAGGGTLELSQLAVLQVPLVSLDSRVRRERYWERNSVDDLPRIRKPKGLPRPFMPEERDRIFAMDLPPDERVLRALLYFTGLRVTPICQIRIGDVRLGPSVEEPGRSGRAGRGTRTS